MERGILQLLQRSREYRMGEYISVMDVALEQKKQTASINDIRDATFGFYRHQVPELFSGIDSIDSNLSLQNALLEDIHGAVRDVETAVYAVEDAVYDLRETVEYGFECVVGRIDKTNSLLSEITEILANPVRTQAEEFSRRGTESFRYGWYPESFDDFSKVTELDPVNYIAWYYRGILLIEQLNNKEEAKVSFECCARYSAPKSKFYLSSSLYQLAILSYADGELLKSINLALKSYEADKKNHQAAFLLSELYAAVGDHHHSAEYLEICEPIDIVFFFKSFTNAPLKQNGVHDRVYCECAENLIGFNQETKIQASKALKIAQQLPDEIDAQVLRLLDEIVRIVSEVVKESDYPSQRAGHDRLAIKIEEWNDLFKKSVAAFAAKHNNEKKKYETDKSNIQYRKYNVRKTPIIDIEGDRKRNRKAEFISFIFFILLIFAIPEMPIASDEDDITYIGHKLINFLFLLPVFFGCKWILNTYWSRKIKESIIYKNLRQIEEIFSTAEKDWRTISKKWRELLELKPALDNFKQRNFYH